MGLALTVFVLLELGVFVHTSELNDDLKNGYCVFATVLILIGCVLNGLFN